MSPRQPALALPAGRGAFLVAVALVMVSDVMLPLQDALTKRFVEAVPVAQLLLVRSFTVMALALAFGRGRLAGRIVRSPVKRTMILRALVMFAAWSCFYLALAEMPLAQAVTLYFVSPIFVAVASGPVLGEWPSARHWLAILVGFLGVVLASGLVRFELTTAVALALASSALWAAALLMLRSMASEESSLVQVTVANGVFVLAGAVQLPFTGWHLAPAELFGVALIGVVGGTGQFALYEAARRLPAHLIAVLEYGGLITGFALGYLMFGDVPTALVTFGAVLVVISGVQAVRLESRRADGGAQAPDALVSDALAPGELAALPGLPLTPFLPPSQQETSMSKETHDLVVNYIAKYRFPFPGQTTWPEGYVTTTNVPQAKASIPTPAGAHFPDIVITDRTGRVRELGEVEMAIGPQALPYLKAGSELTDNDTPTQVKHFFVYVPAGQEAVAQKLLEDNAISYAGVRGFTVNADGTVKIVPFVTKGDQYDHQITDPAAA
ncbi:DMT family transporter [Ancylobacter sp. Lp-2]|uniref:DMT family transporter n=1 Tax=Ancylobacter sp. Lp-2 TaxID=2881339 RepID=UPI001E46068F|nr:DMT family transporter [Ancylobacter sp. Lp-2]MCB4770006.1 DMT family transporter [Ancylobacter sp. Lp-2]